MLFLDFAIIHWIQFSDIYLGKTPMSGNVEPTQKWRTWLRVLSRFQMDTEIQLLSLMGIFLSFALVTIIVVTL